MVRLSLLCLALLLAVVAPARAATVSVAVTQHDRFVTTDTTVAGGPEDDRLMVAVAGNDLVVRDASAPLLAGTGCTAVDGQTVRCPRATSLHLVGGPGDDRLDLAGLAAGALFVDADGGPGDDVLAGGAGFDRLTGGPGRDQLTGGPGDDLFFDADGPDASVDVYDGGADLDVISYAGAGDLVADLPRQTATRGRATEALSGIEGVYGGDGDDLLRGDGRLNQLMGGRGDDILEGGPGDDRLDGGTGRDTLRGGEDLDTLRGGGSDSIRDGGPGDDKILLGPGRNDGGPGNDELAVQGPAGATRCGTGRDLVIASFRPLTVARDCERVAVGVLRLVTPRPKLLHASLHFATRCPLTCQATATVDVRVGTKVIARGTLRALSPASSARRASVPLTAAGRRLVARRPGAVLTIRVGRTRWRSAVARCPCGS